MVTLKSNGFFSLQKVSKHLFRLLFQYLGEIFKGGQPVLQNLFSREPYSCLHFLSDPDSVLLLAVSKIMMPNVLDQIRNVNSDHADSILRDCIFLLTGKGFKVIFGLMSVRLTCFWAGRSIFGKLRHHK